MPNASSELSLGAELMITWVISLPEAKIRRQAISEQLRVAGLPFPKLSTAWSGKLLLHHLFMKQHLSSSWRVLVAILGLAK